MEEKRKAGKPKGLPKTGGRKKGTINVSKANFYSVLTLKIAERIPSVFDWLDSIDDPYQKVNALIKIMEFRYPKQKSVEFKMDEETSSSLEDKLYKMLYPEDK